MSSPPPSTEIDVLLRERNWLRGLASALVRDEHAAEDLTQDVYLLVLDRAPSNLRHPRAWLATVLRRLASNRARAESRRRRHERALAPAEPGSQRAVADSTDSLVARAELVERLAQLVLDLPDPYRTTVLMRYFGSEPPRRVAELMGVPVETVRTRLKRAMATLRERMDRRHGGSRALWASPLQDWMQPPVAATASGGGLLFKAGVAAALLLLLASGIALWQNERAPPSAQPVATLPPARAGSGPGLSLQGQAPPTSAAPTATARRNAIFLNMQRPKLVVTGRVMRADGAPARNAAVSVWSLHRHVEPTRTDTTGAYRLVLGRPPRVLDEALAIQVVARDGTAGLAEYRLWAGTPTNGTAQTILLRRALALRVRITQRGAPVPYARVVLSSLAFSSWIPRWELRADESGHAQFAGLTQHGWRIDASSPNAGRGTIICPVPVDPKAQVELVLQPAQRTIAVRVLTGESGIPIAGAWIEVLEQRKDQAGGPASTYVPRPVVAPTDQDGRTIVRALDPKARISLVAHVRGRSPSGARAGTYVGPFRIEAAQEVPVDAREVVLHVAGPREVSWPLDSADGAVVPANGTSIRIRVRGRPELAGMLALTDAHIEDGHLRASMPLTPRSSFAGIAQAPDGTLAVLALPPGDTQGPAVSFLAPGTVEVALEYLDGTPASAVRVQVEYHVRTTDQEGRVQFDGLASGRYAAVLLPAGSNATKEYKQKDILGTATLAKNRTSLIEASISREREVLLTLRRKGEPYLPPDLRLTIGNNKLAHTKVAEEPGSVRLFVRPDPLTKVVRFLMGTPHCGTRWIELHAEPGSAPLRHVQDLEPAAPLRVRVLPPSDEQFRVVVQRWDADAREWRRDGYDSRLPFPQFDLLPEVLEWQGVQAGRCRVLDELSGVRTPEFRFDPAAPPLEVVLDLRNVVELAGRIQLPPGYTAKDTLVAVEGRPLWPLPFGRRGGLVVDEDGTFPLRLARGATPILIVEHPGLLLAQGGTRVRLRAGERANLRLVAGAQAWFSLHPETRPGADKHFAYAPLHLRLRRCGEDAPPPRAYFFRPAEIPVRFGGFEPGTFDLTIDLAPWAPLRLEGLALRKAATDLGELRLPIGASLQVALLLPNDAASLPLELTAQSQAIPTAIRRVRSHSDEPILLPGLCLGRHEALLRRTDTGTVLGTWWIEIEANEQTVARSLDLR